jgi:hypothetical protein
MIAWDQMGLFLPSMWNIHDPFTIELVACMDAMVIARA